MDQWEATHCNANGIRISYTRTGGNKPPIILLHGLMTDGVSCWSSIARALSADYDVIMPDARGHGKSSSPASGYSFDDQADDLIGLIDTLELASPILLGHSMGGMTAAVAASRKTTPLKGLGLVEPAFLSPISEHEMGDYTTIDQYRSSVKVKVKELLSQSHASRSNLAVASQTLFSQTRPKTSKAAFDVLIPPIPDYRALIASLEIPTIVVVAKKGFLSDITSQGLECLNARLQVVQIENASHNLHIDQQDSFIDIVLPFIDAIR